MVKISSIRRTSSACPSQWEGSTEDGKIVYFRFRHGELSHGIGDSQDEAVRDSLKSANRMQITDDLFAGELSYYELKRILSNLNLYQFPKYKD